MKISYFLVLFLFLCINQLSAQTDPLITNGKARQKEGKHEQAILDFTEAIKKNDTEVQAFLKKWDELQKISEFERAEKGLEAPPVQAAFALPYYLRGISYVLSNKKDEALNDFSTAIKIDPRSSGAYFERGKILWESGKKFEGCYDLGMAKSLGDTVARDLFDEKFCWNEAAGFYKEALSKLKLNQYEVALELIQRSIQLCPDSATYFLIRGKCYLGMGKLDLAFPDLDKAISAMPNSAEAYFSRGVAFYTKRKFQEAFEDLDKALRINDRFVDAYLHRAYACEGLNKVQSALYDYQQVQRIKPNDPYAYYKSALLKNDNGDPKGACLDFKKAASLGHAEAADYAKSCK